MRLKLKSKKLERPEKNILNSSSSKEETILRLLMMLKLLKFSKEINLMRKKQLLRSSKMSTSSNLNIIKNQTNFTDKLINIENI